MTARFSPLNVMGLLLLLATAAGAGQSASVETVLQRVEARWESLTDYECISDSESRLGSKVEAASLHLWFRKPALLRTRVLAGRGRGSEVVVDAGGKVRARKGGILKPFVIRLDADDRRLRGIRGVPLTDLPWGAFYRKLRERAALPGAKTVLSPRPAENLPYEVVLTYPQGGKQMRELYRFDPQLWVMVEGDVYEDSVRVDHVVFHDIKLDTGVPASRFKL